MHTVIFYNSQSKTIKHILLSLCLPLSIEFLSEFLILIINLDIHTTIFTEHCITREKYIATCKFCVPLLYSLLMS